MNLAVIPARGGSKRIPRKNIREFCGKPIIGYSIEAALASGLFDRVIVSTDDEEIATVARAFGAEAPFIRPSSLADDHTGTNAVVRHAIAWHQERGQPVDYACCIYATAPFIQARYLREGFEKLMASGKSDVFSVTRFAFPIQWAIRLNARGEVEALFPEHVFSRSQDLEEAYHDAGQFYWGRAQAYPVVSLAGYRERQAELDASRNPFAVVTQAHLKAQETAHSDEARYQAKRVLIRSLYRRGYQRAEILELFRFIDGVLVLPEALEDRLWVEMQQFEEEKRMRYVSSFERIAQRRGMAKGMEKGMEKGIGQGQAKLLKLQIQQRFGPLPMEVETRLRDAPPEQLEAWALRVLEAASLDEVFE